MLRYSVIVPVRDEEEHIGRMLDSVLSQTLQPQSVHVVDDGSLDQTPEILACYARKFRFIRVTTKANSGRRREGGEAAIQVGFRSVDWSTTDILARLDSDISFGPDLFAFLVGRFEAEPKLGITSGVLYEQENGSWVPQPCPTYHTRGACKLYRRECYHQIEPIASCLGWDGQDEARANCYGWKTQSFPEARVYHHRRIGTFVGRARFAWNLGISAYYIGYHPAFMLARACRSLTRRPWLVLSFLMLCGMADGYLRARPRESRKEVIGFVRKQQLKRLLGRNSVWKMIILLLSQLSGMGIGLDACWC